MTIHLIKLCVGAESIQDLAEWQARYMKKEVMHVTRMTPKRHHDLLEGGSLYWVIKGVLCARQELLALKPTTKNGIPHCGLVLSPEIIRVHPREYRAFQGWRYLEPKDAPRDLATGEIDADMPEKMRRELAKLGLL